MAFFQKRNTSAETEIFFLTGASGFSGGRLAKETHYRASAPVTAWKLPQADHAYPGDFSLCCLADDQRMKELIHAVQADEIYQAMVHLEEDGKTLTLLNDPVPAQDPILSQLQAEQTKPVTMDVPDLGSFTLNRALNWFEGNVLWCGQPVELQLDNNEELQSAIAHTLTLLKDDKEWDQKLRLLACDQLLELADDWADSADYDEDEEDSPHSITAEEFLSRLSLSSFRILGDGSFEFWFDDGDLFFGHSICVEGDLTRGPVQADMMG